MQQLQVPLLKTKSKIADTEQRRACCIYASPVLLCYEPKRKLPVPLKSVTYHLKVQKGHTCVEIEQIYSTMDQEQPIDLEYLFLINKNAVVTKMIVELGDKKVIGIIKELQEAKQQYQEGIKQGKTMAYCEEDESFPEIKRIKLGQLAPQKQLKITFEYIQPLEVCFNRFYKIEVSPLIDENYTKSVQSSKDKKIYNFINRFVSLNEIKYGFTQDFKINIDIGSKITFLKSPTHTIVILKGKENFVKNDMGHKLQIGLEANQDNYSPNKQFTILFSTEDINQPTAILSHTNNDALQYQKYCATLTFVPKFNEIPLDDAYQQYLDKMSYGQNAQVKRGNYLFIIDRSGSMGGSRIDSAKEALILFLKSLPEDSQFNIISFGSNSSSLWNESKPYNQESLDEAVRFTQTIDADFGGTEIRCTLEKVVYNKKYGQQSSQTLNVFLLTDGEDTPQPIIDLVQKYNKPETRVYTIGIGEGCNQYLIKRIAEVGNGKCQFVIDNTDISEKVIDLLDDSITSQLEYFNVNCNAQNIAQIIPNPESIVTVKKNQLFTLQILFSANQAKSDLEFSLGWYDPQTQKQILHQVNLNLKDSQANEYFHKLAIHKYITYYEDAQRNGGTKLIEIKTNKKIIEEQDLLNLSIEHQILSSKTAFICEVCDIKDSFKQQKREKVIINQVKTFEQKDYEDFQIQSSGTPPAKRAKKFKMSLEKKASPPQIVNCCMQQSDEMCLQERFLCQNFVSPNFPLREVECMVIQDNIFRSQRVSSQKKIEKLEETSPRMNLKNNLFGKSDEEMPVNKCVYKSEGFESDNLGQDKKKSLKKHYSYTEVIQYAQADGSFAFSTQIISQLHFNQMKNKQNFVEKVWYTILALFYLELFCKEQKATWHLVYSKGIIYLQKNGIKYLDIKGQWMEEYKQMVEQQ